MPELKPGLAGTAETIVRETNTAIAMGSGSLQVFATPCMVALMEQAACNAVDPCFNDSESSVGTLVNITHDAATALGKKLPPPQRLLKCRAANLFLKLPPPMKINK